METLASPGRQLRVPRTLIENGWERFRSALSVPVDTCGLDQEPLL
jgi:hypothetical protein